MLMKGVSTVCWLALIGYGAGTCQARDASGAAQPQLPPLETFILEPVAVEPVSIWVLGAKAGPEINRGCGPRNDCTYACCLPAVVTHAKTDSCPDTLARLLAQSIAPRFDQAVPLTIFNGWQWECFYGLSQYHSVSYDLAAHGGGWECALECVLRVSGGAIVLRPLNALSPSGQTPVPPGIDACSTLEVMTFDSMRVRDGYPKTLQF
jgi:hypothetical protein